MQKHRGLTHIIKATGYSLQGLKWALKETAFRHELLLCLIGIPLACWLADTPIEMALMIGSLLLILVAELLNSAIESVVDLVSPNYHPLAGRAKDLGSASVFICMLICLLVWGIILFG